jgi:hypothetical protein
MRRDPGIGPSQEAGGYQVLTERAAEWRTFVSTGTSGKA